MTWSNCYLIIVFYDRLPWAKKGIFGEIFCIQYTVNLGGGCLWDSYEPKLSKCHLIIVFCSSLAIKGHHVAFKGHQRPICVYIFLLSHNYLLSSATLQPIFGLSYIYLSIISWEDNCKIVGRLYPEKIIVRWL